MGFEAAVTVNRPRDCPVATASAATDGTVGGIARSSSTDGTVIEEFEVTGDADPPACTRVPGTSPWFLGVANIRGNLVSVMDLHGFMGGGRSPQGRHARVLMYQREGVAAAFRVDDVLGLQRFYMERQTTVSVDAGALTPYLNGGFRRRNEEWAVLSLADFVVSRDFLDISR
jgi:twitching motility protein PilI